MTCICIRPSPSLLCVTFVVHTHVHRMHAQKRLDALTWTPYCQTAPARLTRRQAREGPTEQAKVFIVASNKKAYVYINYHNIYTCVCVCVCVYVCVCVCVCVCVQFLQWIHLLKAECIVLVSCVTHTLCKQLQTQSPVRSNVKITLRYLGKCGPVKRFSSNTVEVLQQHCGGNTVSLFKGGLKERGEDTLFQEARLFHL